MQRLLGSSRLVTLTGAGGSGKTRLALRAAATLARGFTHGTWFVDLAQLEDAALLDQVIAATLGLHDRRATSPSIALGEYLANKNLLLILDNSDHLRDRCAQLADALLRQSAHLRILSTSRHTLGVTGEHVFRVPPMTVPDHGAVVQSASLAHYEALNLFVERAQAVRPGFELTDSTASAITAICETLDGIPLAIELAAARVSALSVHDLLERLEDRFGLLVGGSPSALPRHRTLRELVGWSWDLCSEVERTIWARLSIFPSSFDVAAAEAVCSGQPLERTSVLDIVTALVDKSIVTAQEEAGRIRYRMLETLRRFGLEQLDTAGERADLRGRHRNYYIDMAHEAGVDWLSTRQTTWLERLQLEQSNLRAALDASLDNPDEVDSGLDVASDLWFFWIASGQTHEARRWFERGLASSSLMTTARARAMAMCAYICVQQEDLAAAVPLIESAQAVAEEQGHRSNIAWVTQVRAMAAMCEGDLRVAERLFGEALDAHRANDDLVGAIDTTFFLAAVSSLSGSPDRAEMLYREGIISCEERGETWYKGYLLWGLALVAWQRGDVERAAAHASQSLRIGRALRERWVIAFSVELLAWTTAAAGRDKEAARLLGAVVELWRAAGWQQAGVPPFYGMHDLSVYHEKCVATVEGRLGAESLETRMQDGAALEEDDILSEALGESRVKTASASHKSTGALPSLTRREAQIAELVSQGLSNREIAADLVISPRTAEVHVLNILTKLGFKSRAQVAAWVVSERARRGGDA